MKTILLLLLSALLLTAVGCDSRTDVPPTETAAEESVKECIYTIVRGEECPKEETAAAVRLRNTLEEMGYTVVLTTDWVNRGELVEDHRYPHEILIGDTNRPESEKRRAELQLNTPELMEYVVTSEGDHYTAVASPGFMDDAITVLLAHLTEDPARLASAPVTADYRKDHVFPMEDITVCGVSLLSYDGILVNSTYSDAMLRDVQALADTIYQACGFRLPVTKAKGDENGLYIRLGERTDESVQAGGEFSYGMIPTAEGLLLEGQDMWNDWCALDVFAGMLNDALSAGQTTLALDTPVYRITDKANDDRLNTFQIAAWVIGASEMKTEEQFREIAECGFNQIILQSPGEDTHHNFCKWMAKYELRGLWQDDAATQVGWESRGGKLGKLRPYMGDSVTWGHVLRDEPNTTLYETLAALQNAYLEVFPDRFPYVNLFPIYASNEQMQTSGSHPYESYDEYLTKFFDIVQPPYTSVDIYPLNTGGRIIDDYYVNLEKFATICRDRAVPYGVYIQSVSFAPSKRTPTEAEMRWQAYNALAFGAVNIEYFTYRTPDSSVEDFKDALIGRDNQKKDGWYGAQKVNAALSALSETYMGYRYLGSWGVNMANAPQYFYFDNQYTDFDGIGEVTVSGDKALLMGAFTEKEGDGRAFVCVGADDPGTSKTSVVVTVALTDWTEVTLYQGEEAKTLTPVDGKISFVLTPGEGVFVTLG